MGVTTRIIAAVGVRGFATTVQYDLGNNGANGLYSANVPSSGCPSFTSIASNANGFVYGNAIAGSPYTTGAAMNAGSGTPFSNPTTGDQLGRIDIAVAPSDPQVIYAQVQSIAPNTGCGTNGCQLGVWQTNDGGTTWTFMQGSQGPALDNDACGFDYPQNWYDQGLAVDPNNADRVFIDTYDVWFATRTGGTMTDLTCGYNGPGPHVVHVDQHALAFVPGSSSILLVGSDGGAFSTSNADIAGLGDADVREHGHRPEHDRVLLGRHQRLLPVLAEPVRGRRRPGQRAERRGLQRLTDRPCAMADDGRRRRVLRPHRPGRNGL